MTPKFILASVLIALVCVVIGSRFGATRGDKLIGIWMALSCGFIVLLMLVKIKAL